jgi:rhodanese-related sulfurtransferase
MPASYDPTQPEIDAATLAELMADPKTVAIDVREPEETAAERIPGTVLIPMSEFDPAQVVRNYGDRNIVFTCLSGARSGRAADAVAALGHPRPPSVANGIQGWKAAGFPIESG